ncbi:MAG: anti-sigma factor family protein [Planctomycetota bacterium]|jgi:anti-sigma factor RsiW
MCDKISQETLVAFADGELSPGEAAEVSQHIDRCESCREMVQALQRSMELVTTSWQTEHAKWPKWQARRAPKLHRWPVKRVLAVAASILLLAGVGLIWWTISEQTKPMPAEERMARLERTVTRVGAAVQMLAVADLLAEQPGGKDYARERYKEIVTGYSDTEYAVQAKLRLRML